MKSPILITARQQVVLELLEKSPLDLGQLISRISKKITLETLKNDLMFLVQNDFVIKNELRK